jgi:hypothetical protein
VVALTATPKPVPGPPPGGNPPEMGEGMVPSQQAIPVLISSFPFQSSPLRGG